MKSGDIIVPKNWVGSKNTFYYVYKILNSTKYRVELTYADRPTDYNPFQYEKKNLRKMSNEEFAKYLAWKLSK